MLMRKRSHYLLKKKWGSVEKKLRREGLSELGAHNERFGMEDLMWRDGA